jgi:hypothetical protein
MPTHRRRRPTSRQSDGNSGERSGAPVFPVPRSLTGGAMVGLNWLGTVAHGPGPIHLIQQFSINSNLIRFVKYKTWSSRAQKILELCMGLDLNILNNFLNWVGFKFSTKFMV